MCECVCMIFLLKSSNRNHYTARQTESLQLCQITLPEEQLVHMDARRQETVWARVEFSPAELTDAAVGRLLEEWAELTYVGTQQCAHVR